MSIDAQSLKEQVIEPTLKYLNGYTPAAVNLLLGTAAVETQLKPLEFYNSGVEKSGIGLFNISRQRHIDIWDQFLAFDPDLASQVRGLASQRTFLTNPHTELGTNLSYATAIAWCIYKRSNLIIENGATKSLASYWNEHYRQEESDYNLYDFHKRYNSLIMATSHPIEGSKNKLQAIDAA